MQDGAFDNVCPSIHGLVGQVHRIAELTTVDLQNKSISQLFQAAVEELGELARELNVEDGVFGNLNKEGGTDGSQGESVDLIIMGFCMYFARGGDAESLGKRIQIKLDKWERKQRESLEQQYKIGIVGSSENSKGENV